jgi:hypothetical protein
MAYWLRISRAICSQTEAMACRPADGSGAGDHSFEFIGAIAKVHPDGQAQSDILVEVDHEHPVVGIA